MWDEIIRLGPDEEPPKTPFDELPKHQLAFAVAICACGETGYIPLLALNQEGSQRPEMPICPCGRSLWFPVGKPELRQQAKRVNLGWN